MQGREAACRDNLLRSPTARPMQRRIRPMGRSASGRSRRDGPLYSSRRSTPQLARKALPLQQLGLVVRRGVSENDWTEHLPVGTAGCTLRASCRGRPTPVVGLEPDAGRDLSEGQVVPGAPGGDRSRRDGTGRRRSHRGSSRLTAASSDDSGCNSCCHTVAMLCHAVAYLCLLSFHSLGVEAPTRR